MRPFLITMSVAAFVPLFATGVAAQTDYESWAPLRSEFPSTGGGGIIIKGYNPVVSGAKCSTDFTATEPNGTIYYNIVEFDAVPVQGGILCKDGKWRARDGGSSGTTPLEVFVKGGIMRRSPE